MRYYNPSQLTDPSFGHVIVSIRCRDCGSRELAHVRALQDGSVALFVPDPSELNRRLFLARKAQRGGRQRMLWTAWDWSEVPATPDTHLRCPRHGVRVAPYSELSAAVTQAWPRRMAPVRMLDVWCNDGRSLR